MVSPNRQPRQLPPAQFLERIRCAQPPRPTHPTHRPTHLCPSNALLCRYPYAGLPRAVCSRAGDWVYGGSCVALALAFTMGYNNLGQLGLADSESRNFPQALSAPNQQGITALAVAGWHSAFLTETQAYVMGSNQRGQLGLRVPYAHSPQPLDAPNAALITGIATGNMHTVFVAGGQAYVLGDNRRGQLGLPRGTVQQDTPHVVHLPTRWPSASLDKRMRVGWAGGLVWWVGGWACH